MQNEKDSSSEVHEARVQEDMSSVIPQRLTPSYRDGACVDLFSSSHLPCVHSLIDITPLQRRPYCLSYFFVGPGDQETVLNEGPNLKGALHRSPDYYIREI